MLHPNQPLGARTQLEVRANVIFQPHAQRVAADWGKPTVTTLRDRTGSSVARSRRPRCGAAAATHSKWVARDHRHHPVCVVRSWGVDGLQSAGKVEHDSFGGQLELVTVDSLLAVTALVSA